MIAKTRTYQSHPVNLTVLVMNDGADDPYRLPTEGELAQLDEYWWHSWLIDPIQQDDLPAIQRYLARQPEGLPPESPSCFDPFLVAAQRPTPGALRLLLDHWAVHPTPDAPAPHERGDSSLLHVACARGALETARYLLDEQPALVDLHARSAYGYTPILEAAASLVLCVREERAEMLAEIGSGSGSEGARRARFDAQAARERVHRSEALIDLLLDRGACAHDACSMGSTEWDTHTDLAGPVVDDDDGTNSGDRDTVLSLAIARAGPALIRRLLDDGVDALATTSDRSHHPYGYLFANSGTSSKVTLLHLAAFYGNSPGIQVLGEHYAQHGLAMADAVARRDDFGRLPIHYAAAGWPGALVGAVWRSPDSDSDSDSDSTDAHNIDAETADTDLMALLHIVTDAANPRLTNAPDHDGKTPMHYALSPNLITGRTAPALARVLGGDLHASV